ncbi:MAG: coproporphyrinogen dehydrogenase HemZ [Eubacterium sp.]|nr:coproporphyrinogen dehydrogenase HemZ [Eubacterium sp.]
MILLVQSNDLYENDLRAMLQAFFPDEKQQTAVPSEVAGFDRKLHHEFTFILTALYRGREVCLKLEEHGRVLFSAYIYGDYEDRQSFRNKLKLGIYRLLSEYSKKTLPWGSLTGMRPTKIATAKRNAGLSDIEIEEYYRHTYDCSKAKAGLAIEVSRREENILNECNPEKDYSLYVGIPFCPSRCVYCSFAAYPIAKYENLVPKYIDSLISELQNIALMNASRHLKVIYIGGGTPTSISPVQLGRLLKAIESNFDFSYLREYTVEAGRPDSITRDKLDVMKQSGVTRISINPQTMNDGTLRKIGRGHTVAQYEHAFDIARKSGFDNINTDIIAGLPGEGIKEFTRTIEGILANSPESITVHSLAVKRAAELSDRENPYIKALREDKGHDMTESLALAEELLRKGGYDPYYLYRQKNISGNLENVGYSKPGHECIYNVLIMEERCDTFAAGAGAVTRIVHPGDTSVDRVPNVKNVDEYIERTEEMIRRKQEKFYAK